jgi:hypothetical protein
MLIETWIAAMITICVFACSLVSIVGWIIEGQRLEQEVKENKELAKENERLHKIINKMNNLHNIKVADEYYYKEKKEK